MLTFQPSYRGRPQSWSDEERENRRFIYILVEVGRVLIGPSERSQGGGSGINMSPRSSVAAVSGCVALWCTSSKLRHALLSWYPSSLFILWGCFAIWIASLISLGSRRSSLPNTSILSKSTACPVSAECWAMADLSTWWSLQYRMCSLLLSSTVRPVCPI